MSVCHVYQYGDKETFYLPMSISSQVPIVALSGLLPITKSRDFDEFDSESILNMFGLPMSFSE